MSEVRRYRVTVNNYSEVVESDKVEYMPATGQVLFYLNNEMLHIAPASALVTDVTYIIDAEIVVFLETKMRESKDAACPPNEINDLMHGYHKGNHDLAEDLLKRFYKKK